jgi:putative hemolysin
MPESNFALRILLIGTILALNGFFALAEVSLVSARRSRLQQLADNGNVGASAAISLLQSPEKLLSVIQVGVTLASLLLGWAGEDTLSQMFFAILGPWIPAEFHPVVHGVSFALGFVLMSYLHVLIGEVVPKNIALEGAERLAVLVAPVLLVIARGFSPLVAVIEQSAALFSRLFGLKAAAHAGGHTREELGFLIEALREGEQLSGFEGSAIERLGRLSQYSAREIMTPRNRVVSIPLQSSLDELIRIMIEHQYSRLPVYDEQPEKIIGVVHYKDMLRVWEDRRQAIARGWNARPFKLQNVIRKLMVVPETKPLDQLLETFRHQPQHIAAVVDEFGTISGIVTMEDVLEQVFGEIEDEHDERKLVPTAEATEWEFEGSTPIVDLANHYDLDVPTDAGFETIAGFILYKLGRIPQMREVVDHDKLRFTVVEIDRNRIARIKLEKLD